MDFGYSDEQALLRDMIGGFVARRYGFEQRATARAAADGFDRAVWAELAELGLLGVPFAEADGGFGGGGVELMIVMEAFGRALLVEPFLATTILAGGALRIAGSDEQRRLRIPAIIAGDHIMALAHQEPGGRRYTFDRLTTTARMTGKDWLLSGTKVAVIAGAAANEVVVSAATGDGVALFLVDTAAPGVAVTRRTGFDGIALADMTFEAVVLPAKALLGVAGGGMVTLARVFEQANAALCGEAVGVMTDALDLTTEHLRTRTQFGAAIGSFQALQHKAVDMLMHVEMSRSMAILAALALDQRPDERWRNIAAAKAYIGRAGRFVGQAAVQLHGAIGMTDEYKVGHAFKRLTAIDLLFGDADHHIDAIAYAGGLPALAEP